MKIKRGILSTAFVIASMVVMAQNPYDGYDEAVFMDMDFEQNLLTPAVSGDSHDYIASFISREAKELAGRNYNVELTRNGEVFVVTLPSDDLFLPNDTLMRSSAPSLLTPVIKHMADPDLYKIVYAVHTDNTGSPGYNMSLSHKRNNSIYDWLLDQVSEDLIVIPFEFGDTKPLKSNNTRVNRATNRRVEIFFVPGPKLIQKSMKK